MLGVLRQKLAVGGSSLTVRFIIRFSWIYYCFCVFVYCVLMLSVAATDFHYLKRIRPAVSAWRSYSSSAKEVMGSFCAAFPRVLILWAEFDFKILCYVYLVLRIYINGYFSLLFILMSFLLWRNLVSGFDYWSRYHLSIFL